MIKYDRFHLSNGLEVYVVPDGTNPMGVVQVIYNVGSRNENPSKTGLAHLFEHLMFSGSKHAPSFDEPIQDIGGKNNAFTSPDVTNYYIELPISNLERAFWIESDRMAWLSLTEEALEVQRKVVLEEFKQRYLNRPYGDIWFHFRKLAYQVHPYRWPTIGLELDHIEQLTLEDLQEWYKEYYQPGNAILLVGGKVTRSQVEALAEKYFGPIPGRGRKQAMLPQEPMPTSERRTTVEAAVPNDALFIGYPMAGRFDEGYLPVDLLSDVLGRGESSRLYQQLVKKDKLFHSLSAYVTGSLDPGLLMVSGHLKPDISMEEAEAAVLMEVNRLQTEGVAQEELEKVKHQIESSLTFGYVDLLSRMMALSLAAIGGKPEAVNTQLEQLQQVAPKDIEGAARNTILPQRQYTLWYKSKGAES